MIAMVIMPGLHNYNIQINNLTIGNALECKIFLNMFSELV